MSVFLLWIQ